MIIIIPKEIYNKYHWYVEAASDIIFLDFTDYVVIFTGITYMLPVKLKERVRKGELMGVAEEDLKNIIVVDGRVKLDRYRRVFRFVPKYSKPYSIRLDRSVYELLKHLASKYEARMSMILHSALVAGLRGWNVEREIIDMAKKHVGEKRTYIQ